jgi:hypothetical protein
MSPAPGRAAASTEIELGGAAEPEPIFAENRNAAHRGFCFLRLSGFHSHEIWSLRDSDDPRSRKFRSPRLVRTKFTYHLLDEDAFAHAAAQQLGNGIIVRGDRSSRASYVQAAAEIAMMPSAFFMASPRLINACGWCLAELYVSTGKFIPRLFVSPLSH